MISWSRALATVSQPLDEPVVGVVSGTTGSPVEPRWMCAASTSMSPLTVSVWHSVEVPSRIVTVALPDPLAPGGVVTGCRFAVSLAWFVCVPGGQAEAPGSRRSPAWPLWPRRTLPAGEFGFVTARLEIVIRRYGVVLDPVLWQIVIFVAGVVVGAGVAVGDGQAAVPTTIASPV